MKFADLDPLPADVEHPNTPSDDPQWQESIVLGWADPVREIGGFVRIGHQPNLGFARSCFGVTSRNGLNYTRTAQNLPLLANDRTQDSFHADGFQSATFGVRSSRWQACDENVELDLNVVDVHGPINFWQLTGRNETANVMASNHLQVGGTFSGRIRIGDAPPLETSGFTYRDHSWGPRYMDNPNADMYAGWWVVGSLGPAFSFGFGGSRMRSGIHRTFGYIYKDGEIDTAIVDDASLLMALDGLSNRGARIVVRSEKFGELVFEAEAYGNVWLEMGTKHFEMASPCTIRCGSLVGGGLINSILNPRNGTDRPTYIASGALDNGLYLSRNGINAR